MDVGHPDYASTGLVLGDVVADPRPRVVGRRDHRPGAHDIAARIPGHPRLLVDQLRHPRRNAREDRGSADRRDPDLGRHRGRTDRALAPAPTPLCPPRSRMAYSTSRAWTSSSSSESRERTPQDVTDWASPTVAPQGARSTRRSPTWARGRPAEWARACSRRTPAARVSSQPVSRRGRRLRPRHRRLRPRMDRPQRPDLRLDVTRHVRHRHGRHPRGDHELDRIVRRDGQAR